MDRKHGGTMNALERLDRAIACLSDTPLVLAGGSVKELTATSYKIAGLEKHVELGDHLEVSASGRSQLVEVIRIDRDCVFAKPFDTPVPVGAGATAWHRGALELRPHSSWKGRVIDPLARPIDDQGPVTAGDRPMPPDRDPPHPMRRQRIAKPLKTGVRVIDLFTPICAGQRLGIFAGSGVGKSMLLSMLSRSLDFETIVVALVGERGREVREFLEGMEAKSRTRSVAVISTGDQSPMMRRMAPLTAMTIAEYFRDQGESVLLIVDSITRYAHAAREIALSAGELPVARGYAPSVFSDLPRLLERAGPGEKEQGSITGIFAVLVDGDDHNDPIADSIRGTLDGHIVLDRAIADQGRYPAVNPLASISRLASIVWSPEQRELVLRLRSMLSRFEETRDIRLLGGYREGADPDLDKAIMLTPKLIAALKQSPESPASTDAFTEIARALQS